MKLLSDGEATFWLDGDVVLCGCPDCAAPLSIRHWLMSADCWRCETSIELSDELAAEVRRLLAAQTVRPNPAIPAPPPAAERPSRPARRPPPAPNRPSARPPAAARSDSQPASAVAQRSLRRGFDAPPWLLSLLLHIAALILLGVLTIQQESPNVITISTAVSKQVRAGGELLLQDSDREIAFDLPVSPQENLRRRQTREELLRADQDARQIRLDPDANVPQLPDVDEVRRKVREERGIEAALAARDPRVRAEMVRREGGTTRSEAAVSRGLFWLRRHQTDAGNWSLHRFHRTARCSCGDRGAYDADSAATSLALLPFLGAGQTHLVGPHRDAVAKGLRWLLENQARNGDLRGRSEGNTGMYAHGQASIVLCEAFYLTGDEQLRVPAQKAIDFIVTAQHPDGGWRYRPGEAGDTSVLGWQLMALQSARAANLTVPPETLELAGHYLDSVASRKGGRYAYQPKGGSDHVMTAEAILCRQYLGWTLSNPGLLDAIDYLVDEHLPSASRPNLYYWYYATQAVHHVGGPAWEQWNARTRDILVNSQITRGHEAGSWDPRDRYDRAGGRLYATALATCTLEVYYRHLPIFRQIDLQ